MGTPPRSSGMAPSLTSRDSMAQRVRPRAAARSLVGVPAGLAVEVNGSTCRMRGTDHVPIRCAALTGKVGERAACAIYEWRPNPCRELEPGSYGCEKARVRHGLPPLAAGA